MKYKTILADPPWPFKKTGERKWCNRKAITVPYPLMTLEEICALNVAEHADEDSHLCVDAPRAHLLKS